MSNAQQHVKNLLSNLQQDYKRYSSLITLLGNQRTFMIERNADGLTALNASIETLYQQLSASTRERVSTLKQLNIPLTSEGMQHFFTRLPANFGDRAKQLWEMLEQQITACKQMNDHNARLLNSQQETLNELLGNRPDPFYQR